MSNLQELQESLKSVPAELHSHLRRSAELKCRIRESKEIMENIDFQLIMNGAKNGKNEGERKLNMQKAQRADNGYVNAHEDMLEYTKMLDTVEAEIMALRNQIRADTARADLVAAILNSGIDSVDDLI